jgi:hypothetical protein
MLVLDAVEALFEDSGSDAQTAPSPSRSATAGASAYERAMRLENLVAKWLTDEGFEVWYETAALDPGIDFLAGRPGEVWAIELKARLRQGRLPTPQSLRHVFLQARIAADESLGASEGFYRLLVSDMPPTVREIDAYSREGIGIAQVDTTSGSLKFYVEPRNAREEDS